MAVSRRTLMRTLGASVLGASALSACTGQGGGRRGFRGRRRRTTTNPTADAVSEPDTPLVIGSIGSSYGIAGRFEDQIATAITEALIDINARDGGLFGHKVEAVERHVVKEAGSDLTTVVARLKESGVTAVITSLDDETLISAVPQFVEAGIAIIDVFSSGMQVRDPEVQHGGMLLRLSPNDRAIAQHYAEAAFGNASDKTGAPGSVAFVSEDTAQGRSLKEQLELIINPQAGKIVAEHFYPIGSFGDRAAVVDKIVKAKPYLLVVNGPSTDAGPLLSDLWKATLDEGQRPTLDIQVRVGPAAVMDFKDDALQADCLSRTVGQQGGGSLSDEHVNMMLNVSPNFLTESYAYSQQAYDAVMLCCIGAYSALSVKGSDIAKAIPAVLTGSEECFDYAACRTLMRDGLAAGGERVSVSYAGRMGALELGTDGDPAKGSLREYTWSEANVLQPPDATNYEVAPG